MASPCVVFGASKYEGESLKGMSGVLVNVSVSDTTLQTHGLSLGIRWESPMVASTMLTKESGK